MKKPSMTQIERTRAHYRANFQYMETQYNKCVASPNKKIRGYTLETITPIYEKWKAMIEALDNNDPEAFKEAQNAFAK